MDEPFFPSFPDMSRTAASPNLPMIICFTPCVLNRHPFRYWPRFHAIGITQPTQQYGSDTIATGVCSGTDSARGQGMSVIMIGHPHPKTRGDTNGAALYTRVEHTGLVGSIRMVSRFQIDSFNFNLDMALRPGNHPAFKLSTIIYPGGGKSPSLIEIPAIEAAIR